MTGLSKIVERIFIRNLFFYFIFGHKVVSMPNPTAGKLRIKPGFSLLTINAPSDFRKNMGELPAGVKISANTKNYNQVHWFVINKAQLEKKLTQVLTLLRHEGLLWIYYPKVSSKIQTDLTRDKGWENLMKHDELTWISLISFDDTWSAFAVRLKTEADKKKDAQPLQREILSWVNPQTKEVKLPDDLVSALNKNKPQSEFFNSLSFTNKKEYIEWIVTAKRDETRKQRVQATIEKLARGRKNPASN